MSQVSTRLSTQDLLQALEQRDGALLAAHSLRWAHRQGVEALESLIQDRAPDETARLWWREQLVRPTPTPAPTPAPVATEAHQEFQPEEPLTVSSASEPMLTLPAEWLVPSSPDQQPEPELEPAAVVDEGEVVEPATVEPASVEPVAAESAGPEPSVPTPLEPLPPLAEAFGPIPGLEPLPSFNVQAIFAMQSELAERPLAPPIVPPVMAAAPPEELQLEAFPPIQVQAQAGTQPAAELPVEEAPPAEAVLHPPTPTPAETASEKPAGPRRNPFSRLRGLLKDCVEEVASTFDNDDQEAYTPLEQPVPASADAPLIGKQPAASEASTPSHPLFDAFPAQTPAPRGAIAPPPFALQQPPQPTRQDQRRRRGEASRSAGRGAPAPSHPALDSLRSWLPDTGEQDDQRQAS